MRTYCLEFVDKYFLLVRGRWGAGGGAHSLKTSESNSVVSVQMHGGHPLDPKDLRFQSWGTCTKTLEVDLVEPSQEPQDL